MFIFQRSREYYWKNLPSPTQPTVVVVRLILTQLRSDIMFLRNLFCNWLRPWSFTKHLLFIRTTARSRGRNWWIGKLVNCFILLRIPQTPSMVGAHRQKVFDSEKVQNTEKAIPSKDLLDTSLMAFHHVCCLSDPGCISNFIKFAI